MPQTAQFDPNATYQPASAVVAGFDPSATYAPAASSPATASGPDDDRSLLDHLANDPNTVPLDSYTHATERGIANIGQGGAQAVQGTISLLNPKPQDENEKKVAAINPLAVPVYRLLRGIGHSAGDAVRLAQAYHESGGPSLEELGDVAGTTAGNIITGEAAGEGVGAAGRGVKAAIEAPAETAKAVATVPVRLAARTAEAAINQKLVPAKPLLRIMTPADEAEAVHVKVPGRDLGLPAKTTPKPAAAAPTPAPAPIIPTTAGEQASLPLVMGEHLGEEAAPAASPEPARAAAPAAQFDLPAQFDPKATYEPAEVPKPASATPAKVESLLNDSLGGKPLEKNVPLRQQVPQASTAKSGAASSRELPEGFTPTESSVLAGYKYNPATQEFESITNAGQHYVHGEVSPEQAADFEATESKGKAWNKLRGSSVLVAKVLNGVRKPITGFSAVESGAGAGDVVPKKQAGMRSVEIDPETGHPEFSDVIASRKPGPPSPETTSHPAASPKTASTAGTAASGDADLTPLLQQSLDNVNLDKGAVHTTAAPADLSKRWGVDSESLAAGREQTRGMSPKQTEQYIAKLVESYKKGTPVEPVMETRDAANNIIAVDGRARAIAAGRAGVKRIPIIVRRLKTQ
jgi:hypothetical protein